MRKNRDGSRRDLVAREHPGVRPAAAPGEVFAYYCSFVVTCAGTTQFVGIEIPTPGPVTHGHHITKLTEECARRLGRLVDRQTGAVLLGAPVVTLLSFHLLRTE